MPWMGLSMYIYEGMGFFALLFFWGTALPTARILFGGGENPYHYVGKSILLTLDKLLFVFGTTLAFVAGHPSCSCSARLLRSLLFVFCTNLCAGGSQDPCFGVPVF
jgi:hypothetical protein